MALCSSPCIIDLEKFADCSILYELWSLDSYGASVIEEGGQVRLDETGMKPKEAHRPAPLEFYLSYPKSHQAEQKSSIYLPAVIPGSIYLAP